MQDSDLQRRGSVLKYVTESLGSRNAADEYLLDTFFLLHYDILTFGACSSNSFASSTFPNTLNIRAFTFMYSDL